MSTLDEELAAERATTEPARAEVPPEDWAAQITTEPIPEPFWPEDGDGHYAPAPASGAAFDYVIRTAVPRFVDVLAVEVRDAETVITAADVEGGARRTVVLPPSYGCTIPHVVNEGLRYVLLTDGGRDAEGRERIYLGSGAEHAILLVDAEGRVDTGAGLRAAAELVGGAS